MSKKEARVLILLSTFMFSIQLCIIFYVFFIAGWYLRPIMHDAIIYANGNEETFKIVSGYFSAYSNNLLFVSLLIGLIKVSNYMVGGSIEFAYFSILVIQSFISTFIGYLTNNIIYDLTKDSVASLIGWVIYFLFVGTSPWLLVGYTDSLGLFFPIAMIRLYQLYKKPSNKFIDIIKYVFLIGFISYVSFRIKAQTYVVFISIITFELILLFNKMLTDFRSFCKNCKKILIIGSTLFISIGLSYFLVNNVIIKSTNIKVDAERDFGPSHYLMMGLNIESNGAFSLEDYKFSEKILTKSERTKANLEVIKVRVNKMKLSGLLKHFFIKNSLNYGSGVFFWGEEGSFYFVGSNRDNFISPIVKSFYYNGSGEFYGSNYEMHYEFKQMIWMILLFTLPLSALYLRHKSNTEVILVILLSFIAITMFVDLFEARGRYLFTYAPIFVILSILGINEIIKLNLKS